MWQAMTEARYCLGTNLVNFLTDTSFSLSTLQSTVQSRDREGVRFPIEEQTQSQRARAMAFSVHSNPRLIHSSCAKLIRASTASLCPSSFSALTHSDFHNVAVRASRGRSVVTASASSTTIAEPGGVKVVSVLPFLTWPIAQIVC